MPAITAATHDPGFRPGYERLISRGKPKKVAIVAIMRRMLHVLWAMRRTKELYDPGRVARSEKSQAAA